MAASASLMMSNTSPKSVRHEKSFTIRNAPYTYLHLSLRHAHESATRAPLDAVTTRTYLTSALSQYLGLTGSAIAIDILMVAPREVLIRVPREDASIFVAALGQWMSAAANASFKVESMGEWLPGVAAAAEVPREKLFSMEG